MTGIRIRLVSPAGGDRELYLEGELRIGRGPHNDVVLASEDVSWSHAVIRREGTTAIVEDLGSTNGTFVGALRIDRPIHVDGSRELRIGEFVLHVMQRDVSQGPQQLQVEDRTTHLVYPLGNNAFWIGGDDDADLRIPGAPRIRVETDMSGVRVDGEVHPIPLELELGGHQLRIDSIIASYTPTTSAKHGRYLMQVGLEPPLVVLLDVKSRQRHEVTAPNRVYFLYALAAALRDDREEGRTPEMCGWRTDSEIGMAVWGRAGLDSSRNRVNTLTHRVRSELESNGFPRDLIEKRDGRARLALSDIAFT